MGKKEEERKCVTVAEDVAGFDVEYDRYLKEVTNVLNADESFQKALKGRDDAQKKLGSHLDYALPETRSKLDELKRIELRRLKDLHKQSMKLTQDLNKKDLAEGRKPSKKDFPKIHDGHVDTKSPSSFGGEDLSMLIMKTVSAIGGLDQKRREGFKNHEMNKAYQYKSQFRDLSSAEQQQKLKEHLEKAKNHPRLNHPGSRDQLKDVWKNVDMMDPANFDPKLFFKLHDINNDNLLDIAEMEALFASELDKITKGASDYDEAQRNEDMNQMREHVFTEMDGNQDGVVSYNEFMKSAESPSFDKNEGWESVNDHRQFTDEELRLYEQRLRSGGGPHESVQAP